MLRKYRYGFLIFTVLAIPISLFPPTNFTYYGNIYLGTETRTGYPKGAGQMLSSTSRFAVDEQDYSECQTLMSKLDSSSNIGSAQIWMTNWNVTNVIPYQSVFRGGFSSIFNVKDALVRGGASVLDLRQHSHYYVDASFIAIEYILAALVGMAVESVLAFFRKGQQA
jgi:hypothetical protein